MFDFGDDLVIDSYRIPWLIWIQILVMFLLTFTILLSYFGSFALDDSGISLTCSTSSPHPHLDTPSTCPQTTQVAGNRNALEEIATSNRTRALENNSERDSSKDLPNPHTSARFFHPCRYFDLAKQAFLKCLGLGSASHNSPTRERGHED